MAVKPNSKARVGKTMVAGISNKKTTKSKPAVKKASVKNLKKDLCVLILAGGKGTRMNSSLPKPLHKVCGKPMLAHILQTAQALKPAAIGILTGHQSELMQSMVKEQLPNWGINTKIVFTVQKVLNGSGTAVKDSLSFIKKYKNVLILSGDAPLIDASTLEAMYKNFTKTKSFCSVLSVTLDNPFGYGRIIRDAKNNFEKIVEQTSANAQEKEVKEINSGMYLFNTANLAKALTKLKPQGPKQEYYLTDCIEIFKTGGLKVTAFNTSDSAQALGINSKEQLAQAAAIMYMRKAQALMAGGVSVIAPATVYIDNTVQIGADTEVHPSNFIYGNTTIGANCLIEPGCYIIDSVIEDNVKIKAGSYIEHSVIAPLCEIGPYAHLRKGSVLKTKAKVGNFSETKNAVIGEGSKVNHLSYIGDTVMGNKVNVGAGTITCNYDGVNKHKTVIGDNVFVGSNTNFVAPVKIGCCAKTGAGSTITEDVEDGALAIARARQVVVKKKVNKK
ncbi:bifunctional UDP-N-acetylglucosamine pyrophosphorylase/glucosamine-1-phosphate N-acetyltransferase [Elusimicrobium posterum]|uniref:bifunctional UDP-N-acetylglucosamine diphosphorylase/glucosamine-1-phosphate N-acetyltransferase GlmU n=1 Tax=Elusimicrobium posterum TaxID=3116653 RepID=UPI003C72B886